MVSELVTKLQEQVDFSASEKMIAQYVLEHFRRLPEMTTRQLAKETFTSSAAIVRFCQKLGFGGYTEFRVKFLAEMLQYIRQPHGESVAMTDRDSIHSILDKVTSIELDALRDTRAMLDPADFMRAYHLLSGTQHVDFYATDTNLDIANMAAASFMTMQYLQCTSVPKEHVGFFISRTGENRMLIDIARMLKMRGVHFILITSVKDSTLAEIADVVLPVATVRAMEQLGPRVFLMGAKYVVDVLFAVLMTQVDYHNAREKESWLSHNFHY